MNNLLQSFMLNYLIFFDFVEFMLVRNENIARQ